MYDFRCRRHLPEVRAVSVVDSRQPVLGRLSASRIRLHSKLETVMIFLHSDRMRALPDGDNASPSPDTTNGWTIAAFPENNVMQRQVQAVPGHLTGAVLLVQCNKSGRTRHSTGSYLLP